MATEEENLRSGLRACGHPLGNSAACYACMEAEYEASPRQRLRYFEAPTTPFSGDEPALSDERIRELFEQTKWPSETFTVRTADFARAIIAADRAARQPPAAPAGDQGELPELPAPYSVASTIKCTRCGAPYEPARAVAPMAAAAQWLPSVVPPYACKCGNMTFGGTASIENISPAQFTADQMRVYARSALASRARVEVAVPVDVQRDAERLADRIVRDVGELPDRESPEDWPEAMLVTADELRTIVMSAAREDQHG